MTSPEIQHLINKSAKLKLETTPFINGKYQKNQGDLFESIRPMDGKNIAMVSQSTDAQISEAIEIAKKRFQQGVWSAKAADIRKKILLNWANIIEKNAQEIILLESLDSGKPIQDVSNIDVPQTIEHLRWFAELCDKINNQQIPVEEPFLAMVTREPLGVVAAIVPWNFPLLMAIWKIAPALAAGNSVILKPSEKTPLSALYIAKLAQQAGIPDGVFQVLPGDGVVGSRLSLDANVDCVSFTGSTLTGKKILKDSAESNLKRVWLELGGKSPQIVLNNCHNLHKAAENIARAIYFNAGQVCDAGSRILIHNSIKDVFLELLKPIANTYQPKHPFDAQTKMGPIIDKIQMNKILDDIQKAKNESELIFGGQQTLSETG